MPYRRAYLYVLALLVMTFVAFWPSYLSKLPEANLAHHYHAASAVLWTMLAALQSWTIHHDRWALHRAAGLAVFALFPFFMVAGFFDPLANLGFAILFWAGLKYRYKVQLHARNMLGTVMFVVAPVIWRLLGGYVPMFKDDALPFAYPFALGSAAACAIALALYWQAPRYGRTFLLVAGTIAAQAILFLTIGRLSAWAPIFASVAAINLPLLLGSTAVLSVGIAWHGWVAGARPRAPRAIA